MAGERITSNRSIVAVAAVAVAAYLAWNQVQGSSSSSVDNPDGTDVLGSITGNLAGLVSMNAFTFDAAGIAFIEAEEGLSLKAYKDASGYSIGYGHFGATEGETETAAQAQTDLIADISKASNAVNNLVTVPLTQSMFNALTDFAYNVGVGGFGGSTMLKTLNVGDYDGAAGEFSRWVYSSGSYNPTLAERRIRERNLFMQDGYPA